MNDLFHPRVPVAFIAEMFAAITDTPQHTYQVLTKRSRRLRRLAGVLDWPANLWVEVSVEDATHLDRITDLATVPAAVRFLSAEPLLGPLITSTGPTLDVSHLDWVITGGESGPGAHPCHPTWVRAIRDACTSAGVAFFHKQWGGPRPRAAGRLLDGRTHDTYPTPRPRRATMPATGSPHQPPTHSDDPGNPRHGRWPSPARGNPPHPRGKDPDPTRERTLPTPSRPGPDTSIQKTSGHEETTATPPP
jgi:hypothetical protein